MEYTSDSEIAVCNLATICLSAMVTRDKEREEKEQSERELYKFNFPRFRRVTSHVIKSLNKVLDTNYYPVEIAGKSNAKHRPIGLGVQGLADAFMMLRIPFESKEAAILNIDIFEVMYYEAMKQSCELAKEQGPYASFSGSPISEGKFQFDLWGVSPSYRQVTLEEWNTLRTDIMKHGIVNSLLITLPPTATTSAACGNYECTEPPTSNQYIRRTLAGEFIVVNKHLLKDLLALGLWDTKMQQDLIRYYGSVQSIDRIPAELKKLYKTVWEISQKTIIDLAADRGPFICQSQSMNIHIAEPTTAQMHQMHFYGWERGLKTGMYYLRTQPNVKPIQATLLDTNQAKPHEVSSSLSDNTKPKSIRSMDPLIGEIAQQSLITERFLIGSELGSACTNGACDA
jgi:ribonucleoside-diphosphate reductase alpha chain